MKTIQYRTKNKTMTSQFTGYLDSVKDQEMPIKYIQQKRKCDQGQIPTTQINAVYVTPMSKMLPI